MYNTQYVQIKFETTKNIDYSMRVELKRIFCYRRKNNDNNEDNYFLNVELGHDYMNFEITKESYEKLCCFLNQFMYAQMNSDS